MVANEPGGTADTGSSTARTAARPPIATNTSAIAMPSGSRRAVGRRLISMTISAPTMSAETLRATFATR